MADYLTTDTELTSVANAIRTKGGTSASLVYPSGFVTAIGNISTGTDVSDTTATAGDVLSGKYFYTSSAVKTQGTIATKTGSDLSANGKTVTVPAGYYASQATKDVATGTEGTPTATKGTVSNNSVSVTPSVTNSAGYITGSTKTGTAVTVSASELVSGTKAISSSGTTDVTNYASASVAAGTEGTPTATKGTVSNHAISVTPSVTNGAGYITGSTKTGTAVSVAASELVSGTLSITQNGTVDVTNYASANVNVSASVTEAPYNDVIFYDYDGTRLYSYSAAEFANLSSMPANPTHSGLTAQGWNWTLSDAKTFVATYGMLDIGQMYVTSDGKTKLYIDIDSENVLAIRFAWKQTSSSGVTVDFGDGTSTTTKSGTGTVTENHTYSTTGKYIVTFNVTSGTMELNDLYFTTTCGNVSLLYLKAIEVGNNVTKVNGYKNHYALKYVTLPNGITELTTDFLYYARSIKHLTVPISATSFKSTFRDCYSLESVSFPKQIDIGTSTFSYCYLLNRATIDYTNTTTGTFSSYSESAKEMVIPSTVTTISAGAFQYNRRVNKFIIPSSVTTISANAFGYCSGTLEFHFKPTTPPTLGATSAFTSIPASAKFYVPTASLSEYQSASVWSNYASRMVGE